MNVDEIWTAIDDQRGRTAALLDTLDDYEWEQPSLCDGWTVRDVAAHLTLQQIGLRQALSLMPLFFRHHGDINAVTKHAAQRKAAAPTDQLIAEIRAMIGSRKHNLGLTAKEALVDSLVHSQDIALALGRHLRMDPGAAATAASHVWSSRNSWKNKVFQQFELSGVRLTATDIDWAVGSGAEIKGPVAALLLLLTGREIALRTVTGAGLSALNG